MQKMESRSDISSSFTSTTQQQSNIIGDLATSKTEMYEEKIQQGDSAMDPSTLGLPNHHHHDSSDQHEHDNPDASSTKSTATQQNQQDGAERKKPTFKSGFYAIMTGSWLNVLLIFIPFGIVSHFFWGPTATFVLNFIAIIPLAKLLGDVTEDIALRTGEVVGGLLNATFGNAVELIVSIIALSQNLVVIVQSSMLGSILSNLLLVLGMCFWLGGYRYKEQVFNVTVAQTSAGLLFLATSSLLMPAAFYGSTLYTVSSAAEVHDILAISRATSILLLVIYASYLFFQLRTHKQLFLAPPPEAFHFSRRTTRSRINDAERSSTLTENEEEEEEEEEEPVMSGLLAGIMLFMITVFVAICAEFLVSAIEAVVEQWNISETFVGLILLPIIGSAAEHVTAVSVAYKNKMDLALGVAVGSSMQIALLVTPIMVIIGWGIGVNMSLYFNMYETAIMFIAVVMVNYLIMDGRSNWLEGLMLCIVYLIVAISFFYYPDAAANDLDTGVTLGNNLSITPH
ncbi:Sodium/calcium exchanger protein-domain-containing protein [Absidia repens]|uniref:Vacuolar calcium ion transporter n=1 Tax=Absidia repens TaxID=90262 RepID=A0A1X2IIT0_9FUNG|nr:Sodium/calcium exchanger protein-domain-containing protein [Absidia repens]